MAHRLAIVATNRNELQSVRTGSILGTELATNIVVSSQPMESAGAMEEDHAALHEMAQKYLDGVYQDLPAIRASPPNPLSNSALLRNAAWRGGIGPFSGSPLST
jgi:hypothetical protein